MKFIHERRCRAKQKENIRLNGFDEILLEEELKVVIPTNSLDMKYSDIQAIDISVEQNNFDAAPSVIHFPFSLPQPAPVLSSMNE